MPRLRVRLMENKRHYNVVIATPGKYMVAEYVQSLVATTSWLNEMGYSYRLIGKASSFIPSGRELTALDSNVNRWDTKQVGCGEFTYDKIFWIDSDISWKVEDFARIFTSDLEIVSGVYMTSLDGTIAANKSDQFGRPNKMNERELFMRDEPFEVGGVGFGFVAMKSGVFEGMDRPWFKIEYVQWDELSHVCNVGEDYSWCINAQRNGFKVYLDPMVKVQHHKEIIWEVP